jgi:hypothetical protein
VIQLDKEDELYRRLHLTAVKGDIVMPGAYNVDGDYPWEISVDIAKLLSSPKDSIRTKPFHGVGAITVADVLELGLQVRHDPVEENEAHALITGNTRANARLLAERTRLLIPPRPNPG